MNELSTPYHHGALRQALVQATESLLAERGAEGFSLREVARRAGVSPAAPAHHFGDAAGLLTAVASLGFEALTQALQAGEAAGGADARAALRGQGLAYVQFALQHPGRFRLMFRQGKLHDDDTLQQHANAALEVLARGVRRGFGLAADAEMDERQWHAVVALWSLVHGYAHLAIAGKFEQFGGAAGLEAFVQRNLGPILDAALLGLFGAVDATPPAPRKRSTSAKRWR